MLHVPVNETVCKIKEPSSSTMHHADDTTRACETPKLKTHAWRGLVTFSEHKNAGRDMEHELRGRRLPGVRRTRTHAWQYGI